MSRTWAVGGSLALMTIWSLPIAWLRALATEVDLPGAAGWHGAAPAPVTFAEDATLAVLIAVLWIASLALILRESARPQEDAPTSQPAVDQHEGRPEERVPRATLGQQIELGSAKGLRAAHIAPRDLVVEPDDQA